MCMKKKTLTPDEIFQKNKKKSKILKKMAPIVFIVCLVLAGVSLFFAIKNSIGNVSEIVNLLDDKAYTGEQLKINYEYLVNKYGQWTIGTGGSGFTITFVNIGRALFSGIAITNIVLFVIFFASAFILGKWLLPKLSKSITDENQDMVNMAVLKNSK